MSWQTANHKEVVVQNLLKQQANTIELEQGQSKSKELKFEQEFPCITRNKAFAVWKLWLAWTVLSALSAQYLDKPQVHNSARLAKAAKSRIDIQYRPNMQLHALLGC